MKKNRKTLSSRELLNSLNSIPNSNETIDAETGDLIAGIIRGMEKGNMLEPKGKESAIKLELSNVTYICLLDENHQLKRLFRESVTV